MATKPKKNTPAAAPAAAPSVNLQLLAALATATRQSADSFLYVSDADLAPLQAAGYIVTNPSVRNENGVATRLTDAGLSAADAAAAQSAAAPAAGFGAAPAAAAPAAPATAGGFALVAGVAVPEVKRGGGIGPRTETYPFGQMEVGQAFFIPATAEKPNPERSYASSVASATQRYSHADPSGATRTNRKGAVVPVMIVDREFVIRRVEDGAAFGHAGVAGAGVWRIK